MFALKSAFFSAAVVLLSTAASFASSFNGAYWNSTGFSTIDQAYAYANANSATATFDVSAIDYPRAGGSISDNTTLKDFLGATGDGLSLSGAFNDKLTKSVFKFTGIVDLDGLQSIKVGSDDGFGLKLNGAEVLRHSAPRAFAYTSGNYNFTGMTTFELVYYENYGKTGIEFRINEAIVSNAMIPSKASVPNVPVPATFPLLMGALGGLGIMRRRNIKQTRAV